MALVEQNEQQQQHPLANYQFTQEELCVLRECNTESFFQRSLPLGTGLGLLTYFGIQKGYLRPNIKYGYVPKVVLSIIIGYFVGKFSYQKKCADKIMRIPDSRLAELLRQRKYGNFMNSLNSDKNLGISIPQITQNDVETRDEYDRNKVLDLDANNRPTIYGLDDTYRPSLDTPISFTGPIASSEPDIPIEFVKRGTTYEELRRTNREEYIKNQQNVPLKTFSRDPKYIRPKEKSWENENVETTPKAETNKYGDTWTS